MVSVKFESSDTSQELACSVMHTPGGTFATNPTGLFCSPKDKDQLIALIKDIMENGEEILSAVISEFAVEEEP